MVVEKVSVEKEVAALRRQILYRGSARVGPIFRLVACLISKVLWHGGCQG